MDMLTSKLKRRHEKFEPWLQIRKLNYEKVQEEYTDMVRDGVEER